jgi:murein DD-endopeptidase MepM/ murein hydrolase activator NlpD
MFQLPFPIGEAWSFNGVHGPQNEAIDFSVGRPWPRWKSDTSAFWVVAAAPGIVRKTASCGLEIDHADGWTTVYYHLEHIVRDSGPVQANERLANIANTPREAACDGGYATAPHLHFALKHNGEFVPLNGLALSGWRIHAGRGRYDSSCNRMYLYRGDQRACPYTGAIANDGIPATIAQAALDDRAAGQGADGDHVHDGPGASVQIDIDGLPDGANVHGMVALDGWAVDHADPGSTGIDHVHLYLDGPAGQGTFIAEAVYQLERPDVASALGDARYTRSGFHYDWDTSALSPGAHMLYIYAHSTAADWTYIMCSVTVVRHK